MFLKYYNFITQRLLKLFYYKNTFTKAYNSLIHVYNYLCSVFLENVSLNVNTTYAINMICYNSFYLIEENHVYGTL